MKYLPYLLVAFLVLAFHVYFFRVLSQLPQLNDEFYHARVIGNILAGNFALDPVLSMPPGFHLIIASIAKLFGANEFQKWREISWVINLLTIPVFFLASRKLDKKNALVKTVQFAFLPITSAFYTFLYTDMLTELLLLLALWLLLARRYTLSAVVSIVNLTVRQNNLVWMIFLMVLAYMRNYGTNISNDNIKNIMKKEWAFFIGIVIFIGFIIFNGGFALGESRYLRGPIFSFGNIYSILFVAGILFSPQLIYEIARSIQYIGKKLWMATLIPIFFIFFLATFRVDHQFNQNPWFFHNAVLLFFSATVFHKMVFTGIILGCMFGLLRLKLLTRESYLLYLFSFVYLLPLWLIEFRYYFIPLTFFLLFRKTSKPIIEAAISLIFIISSVTLVYFVAKGPIFP